MPDNESLACQYFNIFNLKNFESDNWAHIFSLIQELFHPCSRINGSNPSEKDSKLLFHCPSSTKYISKHRLLDGVRDCGGGEDETYEKSCDLTDKYRFKCHSEERCFVSAMVGDQTDDCVDKSDEMNSPLQTSHTKYSFQTFCDGFVDFTTLITHGSGESDETNCEYWPCSNTYTRCDGFWNCPNGIDELNCSLTTNCQPTEHLCISPITYNLTCVHIDRVNDGQVDCLGGTDERGYCRNISFGSPWISIFVLQ